MWRAETLIQRLYRSAAGQTCDIEVVTKTIFKKKCTFGPTITKESFEQECENLKFANQYDIGPKYISHSVDELQGTLEMQNMEASGFYTADSICEGDNNIKLGNTFKTNLLLIIIKMLKSGFMHMDMNYGNIMVNKQQNVQLIDFEHVQYFKPIPTSLEDTFKYKPIDFMRSSKSMTVKEILNDALMQIALNFSDCSDQNILENENILNTLKDEELLMNELKTAYSKSTKVLTELNS